MRFIFLFILINNLPSCIHKKDLGKETLHINKKDTSFAIKEVEQTSPPPVTIWVHGTIIFCKSSHQQTFKPQPKLFLATDIPQSHRFYHVANTIHHSDPQQFCLEEFYIFAWSGKLSAKERKMAATALYHELCALIAAYQEKYQCSPVIRIIAHSHGGNVVLHMAKIEAASAISIESLILLACPVQEKTMHLINMPMFKHIYSLYSSIDLIQVIAPQIKRHCLRYIGRHRYKMPGFSARLFPPSPHIIQTKIKLNGYPITHTHFSTTHFVSMLPIILQKLDSWDAYLQKEKLSFKQKLLCIYHKN